MPLFEKKTRYHSKKYEEQKKEERVRLVYASILITLIILAVLAAVTRLAAFEIRQVYVVGNTVVGTDEIIREVAQELDGSYFFLFGKNTSLAAPKGAIEERVRERFRRVKTALVETRDKHSLNVAITERTPFALWCGLSDPSIFLTGTTTGQAQDISREDEEEESCYFLDDTGLIFSQAPHFSGYVFFKYYGGDVAYNYESPIGSHFASPERFTKVVNFIDSLGEIGLNTVELHSNDEDSALIVESDMFGSGIDGKVLFNTDDPIEKVYENIRVVLENNALNSDERRLDVEYIDLRFGNKVFYKVSGE